MRLSPLDPLGHNFKWVLGFGLMLAGRYEEAMEWVDRSLHDRPGHHPAIRGKVALCGYLGRVEEGRELGPAPPGGQPGDDDRRLQAYGAPYMVPGTIAVWEGRFPPSGIAREMTGLLSVSPKTKTPSARS